MRIFFENNNSHDFLNQFFRFSKLDRQPTAEQLRIAQMIGDSKKDDPDLPRKVNQV